MSSNKKKVCKCTKTAFFLRFHQLLENIYSYLFLFVYLCMFCILMVINKIYESHVCDFFLIKYADKHTLHSGLYFLTAKISYVLMRNHSI